MTRHFEWVTARTLRHLHVNGNGTNIDAPIPKAGDLPHVAEIQDYVIRACNSHGDLIEFVRMVSEFDGRNSTVHLKEMAQDLYNKAKGE